MKIAEAKIIRWGGISGFFSSAKRVCSETSPRSSSMVLGSLLFISADLFSILKINRLLDTRHPYVNLF